MDNAATSITINGKSVSSGNKAYVIAEIGHNHQGSLELCEEMFAAAAAAGADCVKLQKRNNRSLFTKTAFRRVYNSENSFGETYGQHREFLEFGEQEYRHLKDYARNLGLDFSATAFDVESLEFLVSVGVDFIKIASGDVVNIPLIREAASTGTPLIVSTGASTLVDVDRAVEMLRSGRSEYALLQCTSGYPAAYDELNLRAIRTYIDRYPGTVIGFSSHENGTAMPLVAFALGARIIEKHFTTNRTLKGTDQAMSLAPSGMHRMCRDLEYAWSALGDGEKRMFDSEIEPIGKQRKSIVAARDINAGEIVTPDMIAYKVPNAGLLPYETDRILNRTANVDIKEDEYVELHHFD